MIGDRIRYYRAVMGINQHDLSVAAGLSSSVLNRLEGSNAKNVFVSTAIKIRDALELESIEQLLVPLSKAEREEMASILRIRAEVVRSRRLRYKKESERRRRARKRVFGG